MLSHKLAVCRPSSSLIRSNNDSADVASRQEKALHLYMQAKGSIGREVAYAFPARHMVSFVNVPRTFTKGTTTVREEHMQGAYRLIPTQVAECNMHAVTDDPHLTVGERSGKRFPLQPFMPFTCWPRRSYPADPWHPSFSRQAWII